MKYDRTDKLITASLDLIRSVDPRLFDKMTADRWQVSTNFREAFSEVFTVAAMDVPTLYEEATGDGNFGLTLPDGPNPISTPETFINVPEIKRWADENDVNVVDFGADVLVHEYAHTHQTTGSQGPRGQANLDMEIPAYKAGSAFARKLGKRAAPIVALSDGNLSQIQEMKDHPNPLAELLATLGNLA